MFHYQTSFRISEEIVYTDWVKKVIQAHGKEAGSLSFIFVSDEELLQINREYLNHDYYTDIITFEYQEFPGISGDLFISTERVTENAEDRKCDFQEEMRRVMCHGLLHLLGFKDKSPSELAEMRSLEERGLELFHVKH